jgi:hypothetical protein
VQPCGSARGQQAAWRHSQTIAASCCSWQRHNQRDDRHVRPVVAIATRLQVRWSCARLRCRAHSTPASGVVEARVDGHASTCIQQTVNMLTAPCRQLYHCVFRIVGRNMVKQRAAMEAGWRNYVEQVLFMTQRLHTSSTQHRVQDVYTTCCRSWHTCKPMPLLTRIAPLQTVQPARPGACTIRFRRYIDHPSDILGARHSLEICNIAHDHQMM